MKYQFKMIVFYDNWCPMCNRVKNNIEKLDWLQLITMVGFREREKEIGIPKSDLENRMQAIVLRNNKTVSGFEVFVSISLRIPLLIFFWPMLFFLKIIGIGPKLYEIIAKNRNIVPTGHCNGSESCSIKK